MAAEQSVISKTSVWVAAARAIGAREPDPAARNPDTMAGTLLGDPPIVDFDHPAMRALSLPYDEAMTDVEVASIVRSMMVRTRAIDEALERAVRDGVTQVVILGAGFDTHAYRCRTLLAGTRVFEVDRPETQALKRRRVDETLGGAPPNLTYVPIDFRHEDLPDVLARHRFDATQRTFVILEGVTMYLPEAAVRKTLQFVAAQARGSRVVFDYVYRPMIDLIAAIDLTTVPESAQGFVRRFLDLTKHEPWVFGLPVGGEREFLAAVGLTLSQTFTIGGEESLQRYATRSDGTVVGADTLAAAAARYEQSPEYRALSPEQIRERQRLMSYQLAEAVV